MQQNENEYIPPKAVKILPRKSEALAEVAHRAHCKQLAVDPQISLIHQTIVIPDPHRIETARQRI